MRNNILKLVVTTLLVGSLSACSTFFDKDNTPPPAKLVPFTPTRAPQLMWSSHAGWGVGNEYLKLRPVFLDNTVWTSHNSGAVTATDALTGRTQWSRSVNAAITSSPAVGNGSVFVGTRTGEIIALRQQDGQIEWKTPLSSEILATPLSTPGKVIAKTIDGVLYALSSQDGHIIWHVHQTEPLLILRGASAPQLTQDNAVIAGFSNGNLIKVSLNNGRMIWQRTIASPTGNFPTQQMVDIDADPIVMGNRVYVATYQGRIAALNTTTGNVYWSRDISSYAGMAINGDDIYVSDAQSHIVVLNKTTGHILWHQAQLNARGITGPAIMDDTLVVGDAEGYLHWLSLTDGQTLARTRVDHYGILATPLTHSHILFVTTRNGLLAAYSLRQK